MQPIQSLVIVGGGTAGWLAAAYMAKMLPQKRQQPVAITLIESPDIHTVGVGEGTWPTMRKTLSQIGISETCFMRECCATFKQASKFVNWGGNNEFYYHLFDAPSLNWPLNPVPHWLAQSQSQNASSYADAVSLQQQACELNLAPKMITTSEYEGLLHYAYHVDAGKFAQLLRDVAVDELGVTHFKANVVEVTLSDHGDIAVLQTDKAGLVKGDLFIDCTGFASRLLGGALNVPFIDYDNILLTDRAVAIQVPYETPEDPIKPYTQSTAQDSGWIWDIGLTHRRGTGYVYSSAHCTDDEAQDTLRSYLGKSADGLDARVLPIRSGRRERVFAKNCLGIGLSAAFMEPLEASAIFLIEASCYMLADMFPASREEVDYTAAQFNQSFAYRWDKVVEFIKLHYVLSERNDSPFWRANKDPATWPKGLAEKLMRWKTTPPSQYEFSHAFEPFTRESYEFILYGMQSRHALTTQAKHYGLQSSIADEAFAAIAQRKHNLSQRLVSHRQLLERLSRSHFPQSV
ncbi:tryptophan halogenase family protein [Alteromonas oceanisediminis]|uniref:tryptophan halogenase family protein n=1 Tax=Alteromonas oceanisediminis TaxID=2836180 RepID=UPI001BD985F3|nr:tryptophan halogenase family protein [Alteromonas oceanisediminis]MBT0586791.1 tryptophan 7-halogenase [Alteromonas oceanisediminis]